MPPEVQASVVILAGGRSRRFGGDKLLASIDGTSVLCRVMERLEPLATKLWVSVNSEARAAELRPHLPDSAEFLLDRSREWGSGPGGAIGAGLERVPPSPVLFVPGDIPWIDVDAVRRFLARALVLGPEVAVPCWESGETENLIQWHRHPRTSADSLPPRDGVGTAIRASEFLRAVPRTLLVPIASITPHPLSFGHVTRPSDLARPSFRGQAGRSRQEQTIEGEPKTLYRAAHRLLSLGDGERARATFVLEAHWYEQARLRILASHAMRDARGISIRDAPGLPSERASPGSTSHARKRSNIVAPSGETRIGRSAK